MHVVKRWLSCTVSALILLGTSFSANAVDSYVLPVVPARLEDVKELLTQALEITKESHGDYELRSTRARLTEDRMLVEIEKDRLINIAWSSTSQEREEKFYPIRIPLRKGLLGYRLSLANPEGQLKAHQVQTLADLQQLRIGQGQDWGDVKVYQANGIDPYKVFKFELLFTQLAKKRFDLLPLGVNEVHGILERRKDKHPNLSVENELVLYYPWPYYFFMSKSNAKLANRVEVGLNKLVANGTFNKIFYKYHRDKILRADLNNRRLIRLDNPELPAKTPLSNRALWFEPGDIVTNML